MDLDALYLVALQLLDPCHWHYYESPETPVAADDRDEILAFKLIPLGFRVGWGFFPLLPTDRVVLFWLKTT